jgi:hypothetical protein
MLSTLKPQPADKILELMALYRDDPRDTKIDLGVGIYKNADGETPVMRAIKAAEKQLWEVETTKKIHRPVWRSGLWCGDENAGFGGQRRSRPRWRDCDAGRHRCDSPSV